MDDIHSTFDELQKTLNVRKSVLLMELEVNYGLKHKVRLLHPYPVREVITGALHGTGLLCSNSSKGTQIGP